MSRGSRRRSGVVLPVVPNARAMRLIRGIPAVEAIVAIAFVLLIDFPTRVRLGGSTVSSLLTLGLPALLAVMLVMNIVIATSRPHTRSQRAFQEGLRKYPLLLILFAVYASSRLAMSPTSEAVQNVFCYLMFILSTLVVLTSLRFDYRSVIRIMAWCALLSSAVYLVQQLFFTAGDVDRPLISDRAYAMTALIGLAVLIPARPRSADTESPPHLLIWPLFVLAVLVNSLSRTALGVAFVLLLFFAVRARPRLRFPAVVVALACTALALAALVAVYPPILSRFTEGDNAQVGGYRSTRRVAANCGVSRSNRPCRRPYGGMAPGTARSSSRSISRSPAPTTPTTTI